MTKKRTARPSKEDLSIGGTVQDYMHVATSDIVRKRGMLITENAFIEKELADLNARAVAAKARLSANEHMLKGLAIVVSRRQ